jgi:signal transduction histidine kinase
VQRIVEDFRPLAASRNARVKTHVEPTPPVLLRPEALNRLLLNLLDNALKYGPAGQTVTVAVGHRQGEVQLSVSDEGPGVPPSERERIWLEFQRGSSAAAAAGSGIGLSVVRDVASRHGGRAWVESANGAGSGARFVIALPVPAPSRNS